MAITDDVERYLHAMFPEIDWNIYRPITGQPYVTIYAPSNPLPWHLTVKELQAPGSHTKLLAIGREATRKGA
jgi:hypothetical protein